MQRIVLTVIASAMLAGCWGGDPALPPGVDGHTSLFKPTLPPVAVMEGGVIPANYQLLINNHLNRVLKHPQPRQVVFQQRPYGGLVCGNIDFISDSNQGTGQDASSGINPDSDHELKKTPFIAVFDKDAALEAMQFYTLADIDDIIDRHQAQSEDWWGKLWHINQPGGDDWQTEMSYFALTKCSFIIHDSVAPPATTPASATPAVPTPIAPTPTANAPTAQAPSAG